jgi:hypothetical protein
MAAAKGPLLPSQRNDVFLAIQENGFDPSAFQWTQFVSRFDQKALASVLRHTPSGFYFRFEVTGEGHWCKYSPAFETLTDENKTNLWQTQMEFVNHWLENLKREIQAADLWASLTGGNSLSVASSGHFEDNAPFTASERKRVESSLAEIRALIVASHQVSAETLGEIDRRLEYLEESAGRLGRKDWLNVAFSIVTNIIVTAAIPPETARNILNVAGVVLGWVLGGSPVLPNPLH